MSHTEQALMQVEPLAIQKNPEQHDNPIPSKFTSEFSECPISEGGRKDGLHVVTPSANTGNEAQSSQHENSGSLGIRAALEANCQATVSSYQTNSL
jgi:hypothetical protein